MNIKLWPVKHAMYNLNSLKYYYLQFVLFICRFLQSETSLHFSIYDRQDFAKSKISTVMTSLWRNDDRHLPIKLLQIS